MTKPNNNKSKQQHANKNSQPKDAKINIRPSLTKSIPLNNSHAPQMKTTSIEQTEKIKSSSFRARCLGLANAALHNPTSISKSTAKRRQTLMNKKLESLETAAIELKSSMTPEEWDNLSYYIIFPLLKKHGHSKNKPTNYQQLTQSLITLTTIGVNLDGKNNLHETPLYSCLKYRYEYPIVKSILDAGARVNEKIGELQTPLIYTLINPFLYSPNIFQLLLEHGADIRATTEKGERAGWQADDYVALFNTQNLHPSFKQHWDVICNIYNTHKTKQILQTQIQHNATPKYKKPKL